jgi:uncharacterized protein
MQKVLLSSDQIKKFCQQHHIRRPAFFGSMVKDDFGLGHTPGLEFFIIEMELSRLLGRKVDLQTAKFLSPEIRQAVIAEAVVAYEQA